jgi:hypothetical protein
MMNDLLCCSYPITPWQHKVWSKAWLLWYEEPMLQLNDKGPARRHFVRALLLLLVEHNFSLKR